MIEKLKNLSESELDYLIMIVKGISNPKHDRMLTASDLNLNSNLKDDRIKFRRIIKKLSEAGCFKKLDYQDHDKCIISSFMIEQDVYDVIQELIEELENGHTDS